MTTLRTPTQLCDRGLISSDQRTALETVAARYAVALPAALTELIDRSDPADPIARQFVPDLAELDHHPNELADPIGDDAHQPGRGDRSPLSRPRPVQADPRLRGLLPVLFPARNDRPRQAKRAVAARGGARTRLYPDASRDLGSDPDRRRSADPFGASSARRDQGACDDRSRQGRPHPHPHAGCRSRTHLT